MSGLHFIGRLLILWVGTTRYRLDSVVMATAEFGALTDGNLHHVGKRMELQTCIARFDVKLDMIIRTEESRAMGAKFLDHADLGSREECLRLCCETEDCDVFVFEEKNEGTCFLFECGPAQNFRCKFTHHANYTSAVMTPPIPKSDPPTPPPPPPPPPVMANTGVAAAPPVAPRSKHEMELSNLIEKPRKTNSLTTIQPLIGRLGSRNFATKAPKTACSRFQFQCHSGECIAVYNACDGIPQCVDGSDEGPECPSTAATSAPVRSSQLASPETIPIDMRLAARPNDQPSQQQQIQQQLMATVQRAEQKSLTSPLGNRISSSYGGSSLGLQDIVHHNREDPMTAPAVWPMQTSAAAQQQQLKLQQQQQLLQQTSQILAQNSQSYGNGGDSHIFSHKGGLQLTDNNQLNTAVNGNSLAQQYINNNGYSMQSQSVQQNQPALRDPYMQPMQEVYRIPQWSETQRQQIPQWPQQQAIQQQQQQLPASALIAPSREEVIQLQQQPEWPVRPIQPVVVPQPNAPQIAKPVAAKPVVKPVPADSDEEAGDSDEEDNNKATEEVKATEAPAPKKKPRKHRKGGADGGGKGAKSHEDEHLEKPIKEQLRRIKSDMEMEFMDHDGAAERPGGAVLSLTLGIIVTAALAILIGCRATVVRRRVRGRGGRGPHAHDADFLVNGMYL